jgi:hypothetical protein
MFFILLVSSISVVSQFFKHFTKVEKITIRWIALSDLRTTGPRWFERYLQFMYSLSGLRVGKNELQFSSSEWFLTICLIKLYIVVAKYIS